MQNCSPIARSGQRGATTNLPQTGGVVVVGVVVVEVVVEEMPVAVVGLELHIAP